jgi:fructosamine-3-kinase
MRSARRPQSNGPTTDWVAFWRERRLGAQLNLAALRTATAAGSRSAASAFWSVSGISSIDYRPAPSLLHGDLWAGNRAIRADGAPVVFDPAVYFGDREADLAMTRLFGGFGADFHAAYAAEWPLDAGAAARRDLYNLYHVLNHLNLFGGGYRAQAEAMIDRLLAATGH